MMRKDLLLMHASDLHIGSDVYGEEARQAFASVLNITREQRPDALLIAGDLFDNRNVEEDLVDHVFSALGQISCPTVVLPGNHDTPLTVDHKHRRYPNIVVLEELAGQLIRLDSLGLSVWGRPVAEHSPTFRPLTKVPPRPRDDWFVVMGHGLYIDGTADIGYSSPIRSEDLDDLDCDYVALGHVHAFRQVGRQAVPAFYSGAPTPRNKGTVALVRLDRSNGVTVVPERVDF